METLRRTIHPEVRILSESKGLSQYIASDETIDADAEVIRVDGWRFDMFQKNAPFVNSHNYDSIENCLGSVVDYGMHEGSLVATVQWAIDVPENKLAALGWKMTQAGHLKAVSVGFRPVETVYKGETGFVPQCRELGVDPSKVRRIFTEQQLMELSAVIVGANPQAIALAYKSGVISDSELELFAEKSSRQSGRKTPSFDTASAQDFLDRFEAAIYRL